MPVDRIQHTWPAFFPPDCPPADAEAVKREVYRFVINDPPAAADFVPLIQLRDDIWPSKLCEAAGLSVFTDLVDAARQRRRFKGFRRRKVARGIIQPEHGVSKSTPRDSFLSHVTWWLADGVAAETLFAVVSEIVP